MQTELTQPGPLLQPNGKLAQIGWARQPVLDCNLEAARFYMPARPAMLPRQTLGLLRRLHPAALLLRHHRRPGLCRQHLRLHAGLRDRRTARGGTGHPAREGHRTAAQQHRGRQSLREQARPAGLQPASGRAPPVGLLAGFPRWARHRRPRSTWHTPPGYESMNIVIPIEEKRFYYNRKINCLPASGTIRYGDMREELDPATAWGHWIGGAASGSTSPSGTGPALPASCRTGARSA